MDIEILFYFQLLTPQVQPMQIDTHNRNYNGSDFRPGLLPPSSRAPPNATYSGLLECPCTTRAKKLWNTTYTTATTGACPKQIFNASECFSAARTLGTPVNSTRTVQSGTLPSGCVVLAHGGVVDAVFNEMVTSATCGAGATVFRATATALVNITLTLDTTVAGGRATITLSGPSNVWFGGTLLLSL